MAKKSASRPNRTTPPVRVSYPQVFQARAVQAGQDPKFGIVMMLDKKDKEHMAYLKGIHADLQECLAENWPDERTRPRVPLVGGTDSPIKDGDKTVNRQGIPINERNPEYAGHYIIRAATKNRPVCVDRHMNEIMDSNEVYGGCFCKVGINAYSYDVGSNKGVTLGLNGVQKWADGESFGGGRPSADSMFEASGADDPDNYTSGGDPFAAGAGSVEDDEPPF